MTVTPLPSIVGDRNFAFGLDTVFIIEPTRTYVGAFDDRQGTRDVSASESTDLGLAGTEIRSDIFRVQVTEGQTYAIEIAGAAQGGGTLDDFAFQIAGDNGAARLFSLREDDWTTLASSAGGTTDLFRAEFTADNHANLFVIVSADAADMGSYSLSIAPTLEALTNEQITGLSFADDDLAGYRGDDAIDGRDGTDTVTYLKNDERYTLQLGETIRVTDRTGAEGTDTLANIEVLQFADAPFELFRFDDVTDLSADQFSSFTEMYIAYFNRAPDAAGLMFWANAFATGTSLEQIAVFFADSPEAQALYPTDAPAGAFVEAIYLNVLGRASDPAGAAFWTSVLDNGSVSRAEFVLQVLRGARADAPADATPDFITQQRADVAYLDSKIDVGIYFSAILGMSDVDNAKDVMALYDGSADSAQAAKMAADEDFTAASAADGSGEFLIQLVGVVDDPFAAAMQDGA